MDASRIEPGQRYAWRCLSDTWDVARDNVAAPAGRHPGDANPPLYRYPIVEPERLHEIKVGATVLNVATGEQFEWTEHHRSMYLSLSQHFSITPLLALIATPEEDA